MTGLLPNMKNYSFMQLLFQLQWLLCQQINICPAKRIVFSLCSQSGVQAKVSGCSWLSHTDNLKTVQLNLLSLTGKENVKLMMSEWFFFSKSLRNQMFPKNKQASFFFLLMDKLVPLSQCTPILIFLHLCGQPNTSTVCVVCEPGTSLVARSPTSNSCHETGHVNSEWYTVRQVPD